MNISVEEAVKITEGNDFVEKNKELLRRSFSGLSESISEMIQTVYETIRRFSKSETFQMVKAFSSQIRASDVFQKIGNVVLKINSLS